MLKIPKIIIAIVSIFASQLASTDREDMVYKWIKKLIYVTKTHNHSHGFKKVFNDGRTVWQQIQYWFSAKLYKFYCWQKEPPCLWSISWLLFSTWCEANPRSIYYVLHCEPMQDGSVLRYYCCVFKICWCSKKPGHTVKRKESEEE